MFSKIILIFFQHFYFLFIFCSARTIIKTDQLFKIKNDSDSLLNLKRIEINKINEGNNLIEIILEFNNQINYRKNLILYLSPYDKFCRLTNFDYYPKFYSLTDESEGIKEIKLIENFKNIYRSGFIICEKSEEAVILIYLNIFF